MLLSFTITKFSIVSSLSRYLQQCFTAAPAILRRLKYLITQCSLELLHHIEPFLKTLSPLNSFMLLICNMLSLSGSIVYLDYNKIMGVDKISPKILKTCAATLCEPITFLYIQCLQFGYSAPRHKLPKYIFTYIILLHEYNLLIFSTIYKLMYLYWFPEHHYSNHHNYVVISNFYDINFCN